MVRVEPPDGSSGVLRDAPVLARVSHIRYSYLVVRFDKVSGKLTWDPAAPEKSTQ